MSTLAGEGVLSLDVQNSIVGACPAGSVRALYSVNKGRRDMTIELTRSDGVKVAVDPRLVIRIRQTVPGMGEPGAARVDGLLHRFYNDPPEAIAGAVRATVKTFISLTQPGGQPVWFDGARAAGPVFVSSPNLSAQVRSAFQIGGTTQYVGNTPEQVYEAIRSCGGQAQPPFTHRLETIAPELDEPVSSPVWDMELYMDAPIS